MKEIISKELLSEVLDIKLYWRDIKIVDNIVHYPHENGIYNEVKTINIYELAHKCKEWAFSQGYFFAIYPDSIDIKKSREGTLETIKDKTTLYSQDAIFKACEWIRNNK